ncbi:MAG: LytTR family transcriptional regulator [Prevotellaceae bacterium]|nr:LytTR family transcriptional regulator [Prevotellaceae bacterium]
MNLYLNTRDELYVINLEKVMFMQADDHYTYVYYVSGCKFMVPFGLSKIETSMAKHSDVSSYIIRLGRSHIINIKCLTRINSTKQIIVLSDNKDNNYTIKVSRTVIKNIINRFSLTSENTLL